MKFLYFNFQMPALLKDEQEIIGGAAIQWQSWISGLLSNGHEFGLLTWKGAKQYINKALDFDIVESYDPRYGISNLRLFYYQFPKLYLAVKNYNPDYIIQSSATSDTGILMLISKILGVPFIHRIASDVHVDERLSTLISKKEISLYRLGVRYADFIFAQNSYQYDRLKVKYPKKSIFIVHNPYEVKTEKRNILKRNERIHIAWIGNFRKIKNLPALINIAKKLPNINFKIAGAEAIADSETSHAIEILRGFINVEFVGYLKRNELKLLLSQSIALLNTSYTEGFSNTFLEAWALGVPVITTKNVNPDGIVNKNYLGRVAEDYEQLPDLIKILSECDENEYNKLALNCYVYVKENHDPKMLAEKLVDYLKSKN